jgi:hypothetical protein
VSVQISAILRSLWSQLSPEVTILVPLSQYPAMPIPSEERGHNNAHALDCERRARNKSLFEPYSAVDIGGYGHLLSPREMLEIIALLNQLDGIDGIR